MGPLGEALRRRRLHLRQQRFVIVVLRSRGGHSVCARISYFLCQKPERERPGLNLHDPRVRPEHHPVSFTTPRGLPPRGPRSPARTLPVPPNSTPRLPLAS